MTKNWLSTASSRHAFESPGSFSSPAMISAQRKHAEMIRSGWRSLSFDLPTPACSFSGLKSNGANNRLAFSNVGGTPRQRPSVVV